MRKWKVSSENAGSKLVTFLHSKMEGKYSAKSLKRAIENNLCKVNGLIERFASSILKAGDLILLEESHELLSAPKINTFEKERILYEDETFLFYDKPSGITSDEKGIGSLFRGFKLVHRLDKETTGVILLAKTEIVKQQMIDLFKAAKVKKKYVAVVDGVLKKSSGVCESSIGKLSKGNAPIQWGCVRSNQGKWAVTKWKLVTQGKTAALVLCVPITGRTHQIRIHMNELGHPILGDFQYARRFLTSFLPKRCLLHALSLEFTHPITGLKLSVGAPLPKDFKETMEKVLK